MSLPNDHVPSQISVRKRCIVPSNSRLFLSEVLSLSRDPPNIPPTPPSLAGWAAIPVAAPTFAALRRLFVVTQPQDLGRGRDAGQYPRRYSNLQRPGL